MHGHLEISGPNHPKGGVQYRNQGPKLNVQCCPTLDEPENIKLINKNAKIYSVPGLKTKHSIKLLPEPPNTKSCKVAFLPPPPPLQCWKTTWGNRQCSYKCGSLFIPLRNLPVATLFIIEMGWRGLWTRRLEENFLAWLLHPVATFPARPPPPPKILKAPTPNPASWRLQATSKIHPELFLVL